MEKWARIKYQPNLPLHRDSRVTASAEHIAVSKKAAREGMVLLKNDGTLPLEAGTRVALFGKGTFDYVKGGGGSGDVNTPYIRNLYDGFKEHPDLADVYEPLADFYRDYVKQQYASGRVPGMIAEPELPDELLAGAAAFTDTAVISISRFSGEGWDRKLAGAVQSQAAGDTDAALLQAQDELFERGDFYLSNAEQEMVRKVTEHFARVIVVMNVGGMVDTEWFAHDTRISAVLMAWQGGMEGGCAAAELLLGLDSPSGHLADTFAKRLEDYPSTAGFHESPDYVNYYEDIYVGYRYFGTIPGAADKVNYPFGFGLSYTTFSIEVKGGALSAGADTVRFMANVTNTGRRAGREVLQLYVQAPQGKLGKPAKVLCDYVKTQLLAPGQTTSVTLSVPVSALASYDDLGKVRKSAWVLEKGQYSFYIGTDCANAAKCDFAYEVKEDTVTEQLQERCAPRALPKRLHSDGSWEELPQRAPADDGTADETLGSPEDLLRYYQPQQRAEERQFMPWAPEAQANKKPQLISVAEGKMSLSDFVGQLPDELLAQLVSGQPNTGVANTFGWGNIPEYGIPNAMTEDGPAGVRLNPETGVVTTAFPCATLLSCTWDPEVTYAVGRAGGEELKENNLAVWLTPAVNIHRSPLCGRNFEYYSEDPLLAGKQAAALVRGIQSCHVGCSVKHFALNNKETNRKASDSRCSERALREIYLKQFEIIVKEAHPWSVMSSYNLVNGTHASANADLLNGILRGEWKFDGMVTTDWWTQGEHYKECAAGNDVKMAAGFPDRLLKALAAGKLTRSQLQTAAEHVLGLILKLD